MTVPGAIKPTHKAIRTYREALDAYAGQQVKHEGATETAFLRLLSDTARAHGWMLVPNLPIKRGGKSITPDGTVRDAYNLHRGYWEAKDTDDDLTAEIRKKIAKGYPLTNIIFEDTVSAWLYQDGKEAIKVDLPAPSAHRSDQRHLRIQPRGAKHHGKLPPTLFVIRQPSAKGMLTAKRHGVCGVKTQANR